MGSRFGTEPRRQPAVHFSRFHPAAGGGDVWHRHCRRPFCRAVIVSPLDVALAIEEMLRDLGLEPAGHVATVRDALAAVVDRRPDVVVLDANLQGEPAYRVVQTLDATAIPFVVVTGYRPHTLPSAFAAHIILTKPFNRDALGSALRSVLRPRYPDA
jgi:CheY-like chemotaxis protein